MDDRVVTSVEDMNAVAAEVARQLQAGQIVLLYGELGAGKTTFVQGLAKALGIEESVTSPTFVIASEYNVPPPSPREASGRSGDKGGRGVLTLAHVDLYRLEENQASRDPAVRDVLDRAADPGRLTVIEWADRLGESGPKTAQRISFKHGETAEERKLTFLNGVA
jgi:tRNA threonylcarbamoyladenosine biosynthesis protein TsaE